MILLPRKRAVRSATALGPGLAEGQPVLSQAKGRDDRNIGALLNITYKNSAKLRALCDSAVDNAAPHYPCASPAKNASRSARNMRWALLKAFFLGFIAFNVAGCGFKLRGTSTMSFPTVTVQSPGNSQLATDLRRHLAAATTAQISHEGASAALRVEIMGESREKEVLSVNAQGRVREYTLTLRVKARALDPQGTELLPPTDFVQRRDISFNEGVVLAKEAEENLLYREMQNEIVQLLVRRVAALQPAAAKTL